MFQSPENRGTGEAITGLEAQELNILTTTADLIKKYKLNTRAAEASNLENSFQFLSKRAEVAEELRMLLPQAITDIGEQIKKEEAYNQNPTQDIAQLITQKTDYEKILLDIGPEPQKIKSEDILDSSAFDAATQGERTDRQNAGKSILE
jgi:hypothetical protein